jgi:PilX N-terminal
METHTQNNQAGVALIAVVLILALLMGLAAGLTTSVTMDTSLRGAFQRSTTGFYAAESGLNRGMGETRNVFLSLNKPTGPWGDRVPFNVGTRTVTYNLNPANPGADGNAVGQQITIPAGQLFAGLSSTEYTYIENSWAVSPKGDTEANVAAEFRVGNIPLFQFIAFYAGDLEILPGPNMTLNGRVHTNGNLYLNTNDGSTFSIADNPSAGIMSVQVSAKGDIYRGRKDTSQTPTCSGAVNIDMLQDIQPPPNDLDPEALPCQNGSGSNWQIPIATLQTWHGSMISHIQSITVPLPNIIQRLSTDDGSFWKKADLRIALKLNVRPPLNGPPPVLPHDVEVQNADGTRDVAKTAQLVAFMNDGAWNQTANKSQLPRTRPIFYTDVPTAAACADATPVGCPNAVASSYTPGFVASAATPANNRVYASDMRLYSAAGTTAFDGDYRRGGFYNWRERKWVLLLNINVSDLLRWNQEKGNVLFPSSDISDGGPIIFATIDDSNLATPKASGINNYGVRIFGSRNLPDYSPSAADPTGLSFVTDQALYVVGDYNRGNTAAGDPKWEPAALIGDSLNVMSNNMWQQAGTTNSPNQQCNYTDSCTRNDAQTLLNIDGAVAAGRAGANTVINAAFLGGVDVTNGGLYNGGLENYPRFHENWGGTTLNYLGSFVSLGTPVHVNGSWCGTAGTASNSANTGSGTGANCNIYTPPVRAWNYDARFNDVANLPPNTPVFVYVQQVLFTESFL